MEKMRMESINMTEKNIEKIGELFPSVITEAKDDGGKLKKVINFKMLKQMLSDEVVEGDEAYEFTWVGKKASIVEAGKPIRKTLRPCKEESKDWADTENLYIEGDNLDVLKLLQESYLGAVKMIYIDPPYNTGGDFIYPDSFQMSSDEYDMGTGYFTDAGEINYSRTNESSKPRYHSDWCSMIYSRLLLVRNLLAENGVIFISIDDNEIENLTQMCNEIFGSDNFVDNIIWKKRYGGGAKEKYLVSLHEYVLVYCKNISLLEEIFIPLSQESINRYYTKRDEKYNNRGGYRTHPLEAGKAMDSRGNLIYPIPAPDGTMIMPKKQWLWSKERAYEALEKGELEIAKGKNDDWVVSSKQYLKDSDGTIRQGKCFSIIDDIYTQHGTNEMISIFKNAKVFPYPKPSDFIKKLLAIASNSNDIILDFFSGSASTAHAVFKQNVEDGNRRKFIHVQLPELCSVESDAYQMGLRNICEIGKERIRRAGAKIKEDAGLTAQDLDIGFRVLKLDSTNMKDVYYSADEYSQGMLSGLESNIKEDRTDMDLLLGCLIEWGLLLSLPHISEEIDGVLVHTINDGDLIACFAQNISEVVVKEIAKRKPLRAVFRDNSFANSPSKINVEEIFKLMAPNTSVKVI